MTRRGAAALYVDDNERQLGHDGQAQRLALERKTRSRGGRHGEVAGVGGTDGRADAGDLILGLHGLHAEVLALGQLLEDDRRRGDGVRTAEERQPGLLGGGAQSPCRGDVAADGAVGALFELGRRHAVVVGELVGVGRIVVSRVDRQFVGGGDGGVLFGEFRFEVLVGVVLGTLEEPETDAQGKHVLALDDGPVVESRLLERLARHGGDVGDDDVVLVELELGNGVRRGESGLLEMLLGERVPVEDYRGAGLEPFAVGLQSRGVHGHQHIAVVTRIEFAAVAEMDLESRDARDGSLRGPDFGGVVGEGRDAVSQQRRSVGEERARELHAVARVARKANHDVLQLPHHVFVHVSFGFGFKNDNTNI